MASEKGSVQNYLDIAAVILLVLKRDGTVSLINKNGCQILGYSEAEIVGKNWFNLFLPLTIRERVMAAFQKILNGEIDLSGTFENPVLTRDGSERIIAWNNALIHDPKGLVTGTVSSGQDITERKHAEEELRRSEEKYRSFVEDDLTGDYISSPDGRILFCNPAFLQIFGFESLEQAQNFNVLSLYPSAEKRQQLLAELMAKKKLEKYEMELRRLDGTPLHVVANIIGRFNEQGKLSEMKGYLYDITQHKRMEEQFWQAQKMEAVGRLAGGVAHDFNNLLSVINGYSDLAIHRLSPDDALHKDLSLILQAGKKAEALTRQLLAFSRRQVMQPRTLNLNSLIEELEKILRRLIGEDIELVIKKSFRLGAVKADPTQIEQVLMNLAVNSRDAMPKGGSLLIETRNVNLSNGMVHERVTMEPGAYVLLVVSDTGVGMDAGTRANIFEPFFTTKEKGKGTGLGLSTVYGIIKQSGGYIWVYSEPGKGTTFKIYLPQVKNEEEEEKAAEAPPETLRGNETILLVEDDPDVREVAEVILSQYGYQVIKAGNGAEALQLVKKNDHDTQLMITDVVMPGMSGRELAEQVARLQKNIKVLYISGYTDDAIVQRGMLKSGIMYLPKPFNIEDLVTKVRQVLDT